MNIKEEGLYMQYSKDNKNNVYAYSDIQTPKDGLTKITEQEALALTNPPPTTEQLAEQVRAERDAKIEAVRWRIERARDEKELGIPLTEPLEPLLQYVQKLRDVPAQDGFPKKVEWPEL
jgi:hypothetical protein